MLCLRLLPFHWGLGALKVRNDESYQNDPQPVMLIVIMMRATMAIVLLPKLIMFMRSVVTLCDLDNCHNAEHHYADYHYAERYYRVSLC
jgi:hypothetical protein